MDDVPISALLRSRFLPFFEKVFLSLHPGTTFLSSWHHDAMAYHIEGLIVHDNNRLIINVPPRSGKSIMGVVAAAAWQLGLNPAMKIIIVSYSEDLVKKHMRDLKQTMDSGWYKATFPKCSISKNKNTETEIITTQSGGVFATTVLGALTGLGADFIIIDDPMKPNDMHSETLRNKTNAWYRETLISRLNDKKTGRILIIMQRLHQDDLVANVLTYEEWVHISLPAICEVDCEIQTGANSCHLWRGGEALHPEREDLDTLLKLKNTMGSLSYSAQYLQQPLPPEGNMVKEEWFRPYQPSSNLEPDYYIQAWDTATETGEQHDYSVCLTFGIIGDKAYLANVYRKKALYPDLLKDAKGLADLYSPSAILVENANVGTALFQELRRQTHFLIIPETPRLSKQERLASVSHIIEAGHIYLPKFNSDWPLVTQRYIDEITGFPNTKHDDQVDATSLFLKWFMLKGPCGGSTEPQSYVFNKNGVSIAH